MTNAKAQMTNQIQKTNKHSLSTIKQSLSSNEQSSTSYKQKIYDLEERTAKFGEAVIEFAKGLPDSPINRPLISQVVRSGTSIGSNYMEADAAESKRDFNHKIGLCKKEAKETMHWLRMISKANPTKTNECRKLWKEAHELVLIFSAILRKK